jgi:hypothetical protein
VTFQDPALRAHLHGLVDQLAIAKKKLANAEEEAAKLPALQGETNRLTSELMGTLGKLGFTEEAVELLLAAR